MYHRCSERVVRVCSYYNKSTQLSILSLCYYKVITRSTLSNSDSKIPLINLKCWLLLQNIICKNNHSVLLSTYINDQYIGESARMSNYSVWFKASNSVFFILFTAIRNLGLEKNVLFILQRLNVFCGTERNKNWETVIKVMCIVFSCFLLPSLHQYRNYVVYIVRIVRTVFDFNKSLVLCVSQHHLEILLTPRQACLSMTRHRGGAF